MGQLKSIAVAFFKLEMQIEVLEQEIKFDTIQVSFQVGIKFINKTMQNCYI